MIAERVRAGLTRVKDERKRLGRRRIALELEKQIQTALNERKFTGEGVRGIAKRFGIDPSRCSRSGALSPSRPREAESGTNETRTACPLPPSRSP
jgi:DNA invertase Pin-like site-specific DNA recombinase